MLLLQELFNAKLTSSQKVMAVGVKSTLKTTASPAIFRSFLKAVTQSI